MTRRERLEAKAERRREWAEGRRTKAATEFAVGDPYRGDIAFNTQPGHIPERARVIRAGDRGIEHTQMAEHHESKAAGLEAQLDRSVFTDDADAIEALESRIATNEKKADRYAEINKAWRKGGMGAILAAGLASEALAKTIAETMAVCPYLKTPLDTVNLRARIRSDKERIEDVRRRQGRTAQAESNGGVSIEGNDDWIRITFTDKPSRSVLDALRTAGFRWSGGSWVGERAKLPEGIVPA